MGAPCRNHSTSGLAVGWAIRPPYKPAFRPKISSTRGRRFGCRCVKAVAMRVCLLIAALIVAGTAQEPHAEEVRFQSGNIALAGTLLLPANAKTSPAIVLVHGSGAADRDSVRFFAERFQRLGIAALIYDKRGTGSSGGAWYRASLDDLAKDALAAAKLLRAKPEIDHDRIGIWGISQGGWVILRANAIDPTGFSFALFVTGGGVKPLDVEHSDYAARMNMMGLTPDQKVRAQKVVDDYLEYLAGRVAYAQIESDIASAKDQSWFKPVDVSRIVPSEEDRELWSWVPGYDPTTDIGYLKMPVLILLGAKDRPDLSATELNNWRTGLAGNPAATIFLSLTAGHGMTLGGHHHPGAPQTYVPEYLETVDAWLHAHAMGH
jgi:uncharacterized protein